MEISLTIMNHIYYPYINHISTIYQPYINWKPPKFPKKNSRLGLALRLALRLAEQLQGPGPFLAEQSGDEAGRLNHKKRGELVVELSS